MPWRARSQECRGADGDCWGVDATPSGWPVQFFNHASRNLGATPGRWLTSMNGPFWSARVGDVVAGIAQHVARPPRTCFDAESGSGVC